MFDEKSRYLRAAPFTAVDSRGRLVKVISAFPPPNDGLLGIHVLRQGERLDHLAAKYLSDPAGYWRICELNEAFYPESLTEAREISIPVKKLR